MALYDNLFEPIQVGSITIPNRIVRSAHSTRMFGEDLIAYHEARAIGGVGMSALEATSVHPDAATPLPLYSDDIIPFYREMAQRMHAHNMKLFQQVYHPGAATRWKALLSPSWSVGETPNPLFNHVPVALTKAKIDEMVDYFAKAARRVRDGGLDGIEIHASSGYLLHEFLSPALNQRTDEYGGSLKNRVRFLKEIIAAIRSEIGQDIALGVRLPNEDYMDGSLDPEECLRIAQAVEDGADYISLHISGYWRYHKFYGTADEPLGLEMPFNDRITPGLKKPSMVVGRIMTLDHASALVRDGKADMVSMVRALIADPDLVNKARRLEEHRIRPCIGTNMGCIGQLIVAGALSCVVNRAAAKERTISDDVGKAEKPKKVLVVGGGPAGLEAARTAALRGHTVELHEAMKRLGGQVAIARMAPRRGDVGMIIDWLASELEILGVQIHFNSMLDADMIAEIAPDEVIIATGTTPRFDGFQLAMPARAVPGHDLPHVYNTWDVFGVGNRIEIGQTALVFDDTGVYEALSVAEMLLKAGAKVTFVSRFEKMGEGEPWPIATVGAIRERLLSGDFEFFGGYHLREIRPDAVEIGVLWADRVRTVPADTVVMVGFNKPNRELIEELGARGIPAHPIGDLLGRGDMMTAIHSGAAIAEKL